MSENTQSSKKKTSRSRSVDLGGDWEKRCRPWLSKEDGSLYSRTDTAPAPSKDFIQVYVSPTEVYFRQWKIIPPTRADANKAPSENKCKYEEFLEDDQLRGEITRNLGERELVYLDNLCIGHIDYLNRLPRKVLLRIMFHLDLVSIANLSQVNRKFRELGNCDALWSKIYMEYTTQPLTHELLMLTDQKGWKEVFFMNKLQLQMLMRRQEKTRDKRNKKQQEQQQASAKEVSEQQKVEESGLQAEAENTCPVCRSTVDPGDKPFFKGGVFLTSK